MNIRDMVDVAISEDRYARCLWVPSEHWESFCQAINRQPNRIGVIVYRNKTIREGEPYSDITTQRPQL